MRIALTIHALHGGGAERQMAELANYLASAHHEVTVVTLDRIERDTYKVKPSVQRIGLDLMSHSKNLVQAWLANRRRINKLRETFKELQPDIIVSFTDKMNILSLAAAASLDLHRPQLGSPRRCPVIIAEHSDPRHQRLSPLWETWRRFTYPKARCILALTDEISADLQQRFPSQDIRVLPNAIELPNPPSQDVEKLRPSKPPYRAIAVGRLAKEKGFDKLIEAWQLSRNELTEWKLDIIGEGEQRQILEKLLYKYGLNDTISLPGWSHHVADELNKSNLFILSSHYEALPRSLLEAMSHRLPVVATRASDAIPNLIRENQNGWVVSLEDTQQLSRAISFACQNIETLHSYGIRSREISEEYSWNRIGPKWLQLLKELSENQ
jgi:glycosyltransferase involved in cell wall biosynthesis